MKRIVQRHLGVLACVALACSQPTSEASPDGAECATYEDEMSCLSAGCERYERQAVHGVASSADGELVGCAFEEQARPVCLTFAPNASHNVIGVYHRAVSDGMDEVIVIPYSVPSGIDGWVDCDQQRAAPACACYEQADLDPAW